MDWKNDVKDRIAGQKKKLFLPMNDCNLASGTKFFNEPMKKFIDSLCFSLRAISNTQSLAQILSG